MSNERGEIVLTGLDGSNPLAFLAALGTLVTLDRAIDTDKSWMDWLLDAGAWRPRLYSDIQTNEQLIERLAGGLLDSYAVTREVWQENKKMPFPMTDFHRLCDRLAKTADAHNRLAVDLVAALGVDVLSNDKGEFLDTSLRMVRSGDSGGRGMSAYAAWIIENTTSNHLRQVIDAMASFDEGTSLRWDPAEHRTRAHQWGDPSKEKVLSRRGLNRLALEALPLFPTVPVREQATTVGFGRVRGLQGEAFSWPIWTNPLPLSVVRSLLALAVLRDPSPSAQLLTAQGIVVVFRSVRFASSKYYSNFAPAQPV
jgi:hypothetical protein